MKKILTSLVTFSTVSLLLIIIYQTKYSSSVYAQDYSTVTPKGDFLSNQVLVKFKKNQSPADLQDEVDEKNERAQSFFGRIQNFVDLAKIKLTGEKAPEEKLDQIERTNTLLGVLEKEKIFGNNNHDSNVLGVETPSDIPEILLYITDGSYPVEEMVQIYNDLPEVETVQPNFISTLRSIPQDTYYQQMWNLKKINMAKAWDQVSTGSEVKIAVIDSGVDFQHPDLQGVNFEQGRDFAMCDFWGSDGLCCGESQDPICSLFAVKRCPNKPQGYCNDDPQDDEILSHGTHVTGTINAVSNNSIGISGIGWAGDGSKSNIKIIPVKTLNKLGITLQSWKLKAISYAISQGARVINYSIGGKRSCDTLTQDAINSVVSAGILFVAASGNDNVDASGDTPSSCNGVLAVGATGKDDKRASYSNFGQYVDISAPGGNSTSDRNGDNELTSEDCITDECILSTVKRNIFDTFADEKYALYQGTSMAAPHVTAVAGLILTLNPSLSLSDLEKILIDNADSITTDKPIGKRLNANNALLAIGSGQPTATPTPSGPTVTPMPTITPGGPTLTLTPTTTPRVGGPPTATPTTSTTSPTNTSTPTTPPSSPTPRPTPPPHPCPDQARKGDYNCNGEINQTDYDDWQKDYLQGKTTLEYFEYFRRVFYGRVAEPTSTPVPPSSTPSPSIPSLTPSPSIPSLTPSPSIPSLTPSPTSSPDWQNKLITIKTTLSGKSLYIAESGSWMFPELKLFGNNASNYDGPYDYGSCGETTLPRTDYNNCGTLPLYEDRLIDNIIINSLSSEQLFTHTTQVRAGDLIDVAYEKFYVSKLSYVFYNKHDPSPNPGAPADIPELAVYIHKIEFIDPNGRALLTYTPQDDSYYGGYQSPSLNDTKESFYFDTGLVDPNGYQDETQNGLVNAFDKEEIETIVENQSQENGKWALNKEGSFNIVTTALLPEIVNR